MEKLLFKEISFEIKDVDETTASFWATASTGDIDRDGDTIAPEAWDLKNFKKNPVIPLFHDYHSFPVAKAEKIKVEDGKLMFKPQFAVDITPTAKAAYELYKGGYMSAFSVGFTPKEWSDETRKDGRSGRNYTKVELLEVSAVLVPSNQNALIEARSKGIDVDAIEKEINTEVKVDLETQFKALKDDTAIEFAKLLIRMIKSEEKIEVLSKTLEAIINPKQSKDLFSEEIRKLKNFTIK
jgi:HK97 family phage prohead protease